MAQVNTTVNKATQKQLNDVMQQSSAACSATCTQIQSGNTVFINGSNVGNITFNQTCTVDAVCTINNNVEASVTAIQKAVAEGTARSSWFGGFGVNTSINVTDQELTTRIKQTLNSTCNNGATQIQQNNLVYVQNSTTGDIGFNQDTNVNSQCVITNNARGTVATTQSADLVATAGGISTALIVAIILIIVGIIIVIALVRGLNKKPQQQQGQQSSGINTSPTPQPGDLQAARLGASGGPQTAAAAVAANRAGVLPVSKP